MRSINEMLLNSADATVASQTSGPMIGESVFNFSVFAIAVGGTITGTLKVQVCNDNPTLTGAPINWVDLPSATVNITGAGNFLIPASTIGEASYQYIRVVYTRTTSAAGARITAVIKANGF
jgi:hypothetical protein